MSTTTKQSKTPATAFEKVGAAVDGTEKLPFRAFEKKHQAFTRKQSMYVKTRDQINADLQSGSGDSAVVLSQQMLRNFVFTLNWIQEGKDADRYAINAKVKADLEKLITAPLVKKYQEALQATKSGVEAILDGVAQAKATAVVQYVKENESALVLDILIRRSRSSTKSAKRERRKSNQEESQKAEQMARKYMRSVSSRLVRRRTTGTQLRMCSPP